MLKKPPSMLGVRPVWLLLKVALTILSVLLLMSIGEDCFRGRLEFGGWPVLTFSDRSHTLGVLWWLTALLSSLSNSGRRKKGENTTTGTVSVDQYLAQCEKSGLVGSRKDGSPPYKQFGNPTRIEDLKRRQRNARSTTVPVNGNPKRTIK